MQQKIFIFLYFSPLGRQLSQNLQKSPPGASPGPPPGGGKGSKIDPKAAKSSPRWTLDAPKNTFWAFSKKIRATLFRSERPPEPHLPPKTPREASRALHGAISDPPGLEIRPPGGSFFHPREPIFQSHANPFPTQVGQQCAYTFPIHTSISHPPSRPRTRTQRQQTPPHKKGRRNARSD